MSILITKDFHFNVEFSPRSGYQDRFYSRFVFDPQIVRFNELEKIERYTAFCKGIYYRLSTEVFLIQLGYGIDVNGIEGDNGDLGISLSPWIQLVGTLDLGKKDIHPQSFVENAPPARISTTVAAYGIPKST